MRGTIIASIRGTKPLERIYNARFPRARLNGTEEEGRGRKRRRRNALLPRKQKKNRVSSPFTARSFALMYSTSRLFLCAFEGKKKKKFLSSKVKRPALISKSKPNFSNVVTFHPMKTNERMHPPRFIVFTLHATFARLLNLSLSFSTRNVL